MDTFVINSTFSLLRSAIAMAFADGVLQDEEKAWLKEKFTTLPLKPFQRQYLEDDLENGVDINIVLPLITRQQDRELLLAFAKNVFLCDGYFEETEQIWYQLLVDFLQTPSEEWAAFLEKNPFQSAPKTATTDSHLIQMAPELFRKNLEGLIDQLFQEEDDD